MDHEKKRSPITCCFVFALFLLPFILTATGAHALESYKQRYLNGLGYKDKGEYEKALDEFNQAIEENAKEKKRIRFYGMRYGEYLPYKEKGICYYMLKQYANALDALEHSLAEAPSEDTRKYITMVKVELAKTNPQTVYATAQPPDELKRPKIASKINHNGIAVIIGNRDYANKDIPPVNYAIQDASLVKEFIIRTFGFREGNVIFRTNATKGIFENIFGSTSTHKGMLFDLIVPGESDVFVYYSGHGAPDLEAKTGYILPVDGNPNNVSLSGYSLECLYSNLSRLNARKVTVVTDACFSGASILKNASPVGIVILNPLAALKNATILNSSSGTELSSWYVQKQMGLFTYYFLIGLNGKADINQDNQVTLSEFKAYINENVPYMARKLHNGRKQTPVIQTLNNQAVLVKYK